VVQERHWTAPQVLCQRNCFSTLQHKLGFCYNDLRVAPWVVAQARRGFPTGAKSFD
jgi:hypothetical protein